MARAALRDMLLRKDTANIETTRRLSESWVQQGKEEGYTRSIIFVVRVYQSFMATRTASVGTRINFNNHIGTIKYAGPVNNTTGIWLGVEWDDPARGKHNGSKDGKQYFTCQ